MDIIGFCGDTQQSPLFCESVHIDEEGDFSQGSGHNRLKLSFSASVYQQSIRICQQPIRHFLPPRLYETVAAEALRPIVPLFSWEGTPNARRIPAFAFANDLVLLAEDAQLQQLLQVTANHLSGLGLAFNLKKSAVLWFSGSEDSASTFCLPCSEITAKATTY
ncbi:hypothetical protein HPB50_026678 [Hyalomma asiaticum]|uniref:Uncharacterized protein n=1 Tax=Hyalomma asiaticum TaxID=266040 RepID=A0ACB7TTU2_HYAAI|nr:hypothetical protein HPB50_026678 [Hyalomma asiaticum]